MYEIWLGINILFEWVLLHPMYPLMMIAILIAAYAINKAAHKNWRAGLRPALIAAGVAFVIAFFFFPMLVKSSVTELAYLMDWINHIGICLGLAGFVGLVAWPFLAAKQSK